MAYPTASELKLMDLAHSAQPFAQVPAGSQATAGLDLAFGAQPFSAADLTEEPPSPPASGATRMFLMF